MYCLGVSSGRCDALISAETEIWFGIVYISLLKTGVALLINCQFIRFDSLSYGKLSEWFKELVLKTSDGRESTVSSNLTPPARIAAHFYGDGIYENQI